MEGSPWHGMQMSDRPHHLSNFPGQLTPNANEMRKRERKKEAKEGRMNKKMIKGSTVCAESDRINYWRDAERRTVDGPLCKSFGRPPSSNGRVSFLFGFVWFFFCRWRMCNEPSVFIIFVTIPSRIAREDEEEEAGVLPSSYRVFLLFLLNRRVTNWGWVRLG